ncbi:alpha/beta hydrolase family protein [Flavihumibacter petaseus]|uniref:Hydrolase n=1 Tax=Flavihumibacter petaseus NBRC 106054 TaxID=1220578 RepID=A0A0E9N0N8_9BACT|nr:hypothetical protein [Flavihumibacter petaseus]GAO43572.1 hypothetical protein FPE01S_02_06770 [Flavihumibacter petaseus NBRC 106054]
MKAHLYAQRRKFFYILFLLCCTLQAKAQADTLSLFDTSRQRRIPIAIYNPKDQPQTSNHSNSKLLPLVIFSHGYGANQGGDYLRYSFLNSFLARQGYVVVSIQHELPTDDLIPSAGPPQVVRRPFWERGVENIHFVLLTLKRDHSELDFSQVTLIGHSNGGDMTALYPVLYPGTVSRIITLDNRRMALPRTKTPRVYSLRSSDFPADEDVLPTPAEAKEFGIIIQPLTDMPHNNMSDAGNPQQQDTIREYILRYLKEPLSLPANR